MAGVGHFLNGSRNYGPGPRYLEVDMEGVWNYLRQLRTNVNITSERVQELEKKIAELESEIAKKEKKLKKVRSRVNTNDNQIALLTEENQLMKIQIKSLENPLQKNSSQTDSLSPGLNEAKYLVYSWKIKDIKQKMKMKKFECESEVFRVAGYHFGAKAKLQLRRNVVRMAMCFINLDSNELRKMGVTSSPRITFTLKDRSENEEKKDIIRTVVFKSYLFHSSLSYENYFPEKSIMQNLLIEKLFHKNINLYVVDDSIVFDIFMEPPAIVLEPSYSHDGVLLWTLNKYHEKKALAKQGLVLYQVSPYFYTGPDGYRVQAEMWLDGYGKTRGKRLTFIIRFMTSDYDYTLTKSFAHRTTITIFNQVFSSHVVYSVKGVISHSKPFYVMNMGNHGDSSFIEKYGLVLNGTLKCRVVIEAL